MAAAHASEKQNPSGGILVFHDSIGAGAPQIAGRMLAFCLVIAGAALMPAPAPTRPTSPEPATNPARSAAKQTGPHSSGAAAIARRAGRVSQIDAGARGRSGASGRTDLWLVGY